MAVVVRPINEEFKLVLTEGEDKVEFFIRQLDYKTKSHITGLTTSVRQGQVSIDSTLTCFYNIKHGLKRVVGLEDEDGKTGKVQAINNTYLLRQVTQGERYYIIGKPKFQ